MKEENGKGETEKRKKKGRKGREKTERMRGRG